MTLFYVTFVFMSDFCHKHIGTVRYIVVPVPYVLSGRQSQIFTQCVTYVMTLTYSQVLQVHYIVELDTRYLLLSFNTYII
jgi:hypothetical protein